MKFLKLLGFEPKTMKVQTEIIAGLTTFFTMSYILAVNPAIMGDIGMDKGAIFTSTALASCLATLLMAFIARTPFALAPSMGINAFFAYTLVIAMGLSWEEALAAVFAEGIIFVLLTIFNVREAIVQSIPDFLRNAITCGIGAFIGFVGLKSCGLIVDSPSTLVQIGSFDNESILACIGVVFAAVLMQKKVKGALFLTIILITVIGIPFGVTNLPDNFAIMSMPKSIEPIFFKFDFSHLINLNMLIIIFSLVFMDLFDTLGTLVGTSMRCGMVNKDGTIPHLRSAFFADSIGTVLGSVLGVSTVTTYVESTTGVEAGGRSGLTAFVTAILFLSALFFSPLFLIIPHAATACALILVGTLMMSSVLKIDFNDLSKALPSFITIFAMPLCYSIAEGISLGFLTYFFMTLLRGKFRELTIDKYIIAAAFILRYVFFYK